MLAPQSDEEIRPVLDALRRLDPLLDIRWNPKAVTVTRPHYDVLGGRTEGVYDGRWEIVRQDRGTKMHDDRDYVLITRVTEVRQEGAIPVMIADGAYAPIGWWLVAYMELWDRAQGAAATAMEALWAEHEAVDDLRHADARAAHQEGAEKVYREHGGGAYWMGGAQGKAAPEAAAALFPTTP